MMSSFIIRTSRNCCCFLCFSVVLVLLSSCSFFGPETSATNSPPLVWTNYQGNAFTMRYFSSWKVATKDLYLGSSYPQLEMLQGTIFTSAEGPTTFLHVMYAVRTNNTASARDIMRKYILGSSDQPVAASSLSMTVLNGENWYQGSIEKQVSQSNGSRTSVKETVFGVDHPISSSKTEIYLIFYQDATSTYTKTSHDFFEQMIKSFHFVS